MDQSADDPAVARMLLDEARLERDVLIGRARKLRVERDAALARITALDAERARVMRAARQLNSAMAHVSIPGSNGGDVLVALAELRAALALDTVPAAKVGAGEPTHCVHCGAPVPAFAEVCCTACVAALEVLCAEVVKMLALNAPGRAWDARMRTALDAVPVAQTTKNENEE